MLLEAGQEVPDHFLTEPPVGGESFWIAFWTLARARTMGGGMAPSPNPLAYSEIVAYATANGLEVGDTVDLVQQLDTAWLTFTMGRLAAQMKKGASPE